MLAYSSRKPYPILSQQGMQVHRKEMLGVWYWMLADHIASTHRAEREKHGY